MLPRSSWAVFTGLITLVQLRVLQGQVLNLRFDDANTAANTFAGVVYWEEPSGRLPNQDYKYDIYFAADNAGTSEELIGCVAGGAYTSELVLSSVSKTGKTHVIAYLNDGSGTASCDGSGTKSNAATIFLLDNTGKTTTAYFATVGSSDGDAAKTALVTAGYALAHNIVVELVATAIISSGSVGCGAAGGCGLVSETTFFESSVDQCITPTATSSKTFSVYFTTVHSTVSIANIESAVSSQLQNTIFPAVFTGTDASGSAYSLGTVTAMSILDSFVPTRTDKDHGRQIAKSVVEYGLAHAAMVNCQGEMRIQTKVASQAAMEKVVKVWQGYSSVVYAVMGATTSTKSLIDASTTATTDVCTAPGSDPAVSTDPTHTPCLGKDTI